MKTLNDQYQLIKKGKGHKGMFLTEAKRQFPNYVRTAASFHEAETILKQRGVINEGIVSLEPINNPFSTSKKESYEVAFEAFLSEVKKKENEDEKVKAIEKKPSKKVKEDADKNFDNTDEKTPDNMIFDQIMMGYYAEMKDPKNSEKSIQELKDIVFKNLAKDSIYYTKEGQFGVKDLGYSVDHPGLGEPKEAKGKYKASGYGDLNENQQPTNESESKLRKVIREMIDEEIEEAYQMVSVNIAESLMESVEKDLAQINKEAEHEIIASKLEKVQALIDKKQAQISKLDEDEDMKALTDDKKVKEIQKDIKALEKAKAKLEKLAGKVKGKTKEVIDEMDEMNEDSEQMYLDQAMELYDNEFAENGTVDINTLVSTNFPDPEYNESVRLDIKDYLENYSPDMDSDY